MLKREQISNFDFSLFLIVLFLCAIGIVAIYSAGYDITTKTSNPLYLRQILWFVIGLFVLFLGFIINYERFAFYSPYIYVSTIFFLILTLLFGKTVRGTKAWLSLGIFSIQFSEFSKVAIILFVAYYLSKQLSAVQEPVTQFIIPTLLTIFPTIFIFLQPDVGTGIIIFPILLGLLYISGIRVWYILSLIFVGAISLTLPILQHLNKINIFGTVHGFFLLFLFLILLFILFFILYNVRKEKIYLRLSLIFTFLLAGLIFSVSTYHFLKPYQIKRILAVFDPEIDPYLTGYNINQSVIAIGSGRLFGKGFLKGTQTKFGFLPAVGTDFVFALIGEEFGLIGLGIVVGLILLLLLKIVGIILTAKDFLGSLISAGIFSMFFSQYLINIGMTLGIMPIAGLPLPFLSYGGSSLLTCMFAVGLLLNIKSRKFIY